MIRNVLVSIIFVLILFSASFAQENKPQTVKIAVINQWTFDDKEGIVKYYSAMNAIEMEFYHNIVPELENKVKSLTTELDDKNLSTQIRAEKQRQLDDLKEYVKTSKQDFQERYLSRYKVVVQPIVDEINNLLKQVETQNNLIILKGNELEEKGLGLAFDYKFEISKQFIDLVNKYFRKELIDLKLDIPESKIATINTNKFIDEKTGINQLATKRKVIDETLKKELGRNPTIEEIDGRFISTQAKMLQDIGKAIQKYSEENGFSLIFDSSKEIPTELKNIPMQDVTKEFIDYFNKLNP